MLAKPCISLPYYTPSLICVVGHCQTVSARRLNVRVGRE